MKTPIVRSITTDHLHLRDKYYDMIISGEKTKVLAFSEIIFTSTHIPFVFYGKPNIRVRILKIDYSRKFRELTIEEAVVEMGYTNLDELVTDVKGFYPDIEDESPLTTIEFEVINDK